MQRRRTQAHQAIQQLEAAPGQREGEGKGHHSAQRLHGHALQVEPVALVEHAGRQQAPDTADAVHGDGIHRIVDATAADPLRSPGTQRPTDAAGDQRSRRVHRAGTAGDRYQATQAAVDGRRQQDRPAGESHEGQRAQAAGAGAQVGVDQDRAQVGTVQAADAAPVESEPAHPQNEATQRHHRQVVAGDVTYLPLPAEAAQPRPEHQHPRQGRPGADGMHRTIPGEVDEAQLLQPALRVPGPVGVQRVDQQRHQTGKGQVGAVAHALGHRTRDDRHRGGGKHHLVQQRDRCDRWCIQWRELRDADPATEAGAKGQPPACDPEDHADEAGAQVHLHDHVDRVLGPRQPPLDQRKAGLHEEHQGTAHGHPGQVDQVGHRNHTKG